MDIPTIVIGEIPPDPVGDDSLLGVSRQQTNPSRWRGDGWTEFVAALKDGGIEVRREKAAIAPYHTDAGGMARGMPHGVVVAGDAERISVVMQAAQRYRVPVTTRGGSLTTEGESVAYGGLLLDLRGMSRVLHVDRENLTARTEAGIFWHTLGEYLRREGMDYLSAPLNMTSSVGGTLGVGGIDINSARFGCSADQALALQVVTP
ncbi:MAG: FAD-dependent oxidoreductase, partial [Gammaproteobacteria bacterium]|nr:FAD-dependent oxidoreductase [Gammaproteobacteria bacterium]